jgi:hypothetical protein
VCPCAMLPNLSLSFHMSKNHQLISCAWHRMGCVRIGLEGFLKLVESWGLVPGALQAGCDRAQ